MAYNCFIPFLLNYCEAFKDRAYSHHPEHKGVAILEIGVDRGQMTVPFVSNLIARNLDFRYDAVDIMLRDSLKTMLWHMPRNQKSQQIRLFQSNSLWILPSMSQCTSSKHGDQLESGNAVDTTQTGPYDIILIDGDHNYITLYNELRLSVSLSTSATFVIVDDYNTRWAEEDMYYHNRPGFENADTTDPKLLKASPIFSCETGKHGVRAAVDDFLKEHPKWRMISCDWPNKEVNNEVADAVILYHIEHPKLDYLSGPDASGEVYRFANDFYAYTGFECREADESINDKLGCAQLTPLAKALGHS